jgi:hypothetical protein
MYEGIPAEDFTRKGKEALDAFLKETGCRYSINTLEGTFKGRQTPVVLADGNSIMVDGVCIHPTKFGIDSGRIWFFDQRTLEELNVTCD